MPTALLLIWVSSFVFQLTLQCTELHSISCISSYCTPFLLDVLIFLWVGHETSLIPPLSSRLGTGKMYILHIQAELRMFS